MTYSVDWSGTSSTPGGVAYEIYIPKADLSLLQSVPTEIRELNVNDFHIACRDLEEDPDGRPWPRTHDHNTNVVLGGLTYARLLEVLAPYTVTFEDGQYAVNIVGGNSNIGDRANVNQVSVRPQNSAGLISSAAMEYASFGGGVAVDVTSPYAGTGYPHGTRQKPVNNMADALLIDALHGFETFFVLKDMTLSSGDYTGKHFVGEGHTMTTLTVEAGATVLNGHFHDMILEGELDGHADIHDCTIADIGNVHGVLEGCVLNVGTIALSGSGKLDILDCKSGVPGAGTPSVSMGSGTELGVRAYWGGLEVKDKTGTDKVSVDLGSGHIVFANTVAVSADDQILVRGIGKKTDNSTGAGQIDFTHLVQGDLISLGFMDGAVWVNPDIGSASATGHHDDPVTTIALALPIAVANKLSRVRLNGAVFETLTSPINDTYEFIGQGMQWIDFGGQIVDKCVFRNVTLSGVQATTGGFGNLYTDCSFFQDGFFVLDTSLFGPFMERCTFQGETSLYSGLNNFRFCSPFRTVTNPVVFSLLSANGGVGAQFMDWNGPLLLKDMDHASSRVEVYGGDYDLTIDSSCTLGTITLHGTGKVTNNANGTTVIDNRALSRLLGLTGENSYTDNPTFDGDDNLLTARVRIFPTAALAAAATDGGSGEGETATYTITGTHDTAEQWKTLRQVRA